MTKSIALAAVVLLAGSAGVSAAPPASQEACLQKAFALAEKAAAKKFEADKQGKVEGLLSALETKCAAGDLAGAEAEIKAVEAAIASN